jgi:aminopeptidase N
MPTRRSRQVLTSAAATALVVGMAVPAGATVARTPGSHAPAVATTAPTPGSPNSGDSLFPHQGNGGYNVEHYGIALTWRASGIISARTAVRAKATKSLSAFNLDLDGLRVRSVAVDGQTSTFRRRGTELTITPAVPLRAGARFTAVIRYGGTPRYLIDADGSKDGWVPTRDGATVVSEPIGAMTWFPDNDTLRDKATYTISANAPKGLVVEANGRLQRKVRHGSTTTWRWHETDPMATYLASVSIGTYRVLRARARGGVRVASYLDPSVGGRSAAVRVPHVLRYWQKLFGAYPFSSAGIVVDDVPIGYALEVQTRPVFDFVPDTGTLVHELAHQWYGDSVTPSDWSDIWLNEGFATYAEQLWRARTDPGYPHRVFTRLYRGHGRSDPFWDLPVSRPGKPENLFGNAVYTRGAMALQALRMRIGSPAFFRLLKRWPALHRYGNATTADLRSLAERVSGRRLGHLFHVWLDVGAKPRGY